MGKPRDLANVVATGNILADGAVAPAELTGVNATAAEINILDGVTATAAELNLLDGVTATTAELNHVDGVTSNVQTQMDTKAPVASPTFTGTLAAPTINASTALQIGGAAVTATAAELNKMDGVTVSASDINTVTAKAPTSGPTFTGTVTIGGATYPTSDGSAGQVLTTNGSGAVSFADPAGGGSADFVASGAIANGDVVVLNANGTVSKVTSTSVSTATGSSTQFVTSNVASAGLKSCFDSTNNKVVIAYTTNAGSGSKGHVIVGTVSGTSISFGTQVAFSSGEVDVGEVVYDSSNNRVVIIYKDVANNNYGTAIVGTVSGTSISFGSPVIFVFTSVNYPVACFDSANNKVVSFYRRGSSGIGTAIVGTVSGTSISFGAEQTIGNASSNSNPSSAVFDSNVNKVAVVYRNDSKGKVSVGTVSGTSISFGSEVILESSGTVDYSSMSFDPVANTIVLAYQAPGNRCVVRTATISGTSISFGTSTNLDVSSNGSPITTAYHTDANKTVIFYRDMGNGHYLDSHTATVSGTTVTVSTSVNIDPNSCFRGNLVYDSNAKKVVMAFKPEGGSFSDDGAAIVYTPGYTNNSPRVTSSNYIGVAAEAISDTATGSITINGGINEGQSSLAIGTTYYVSDTGVLQTTNNGRKIGKAISATKLLVNSNMSGDEMNAYLGGLV